MGPDAPVVPRNQQVKDSFPAFSDKIAIRRGHLFRDSISQADAVNLDVRITLFRVEVEDSFTFLDDILGIVRTPLFKIWAEEYLLQTDEIDLSLFDFVIKRILKDKFYLKDSLMVAKKKYHKIDDFDYHRRYQNDVPPVEEKSHE